MLEPCDREVFENGESLGFFDMPKEQAEAYCKAETKRTGRKHDWHYVGGRVHIKYLSAPKFHQQEVDYLLRLMDSQESSMMLTGDATQEFWEELRVKINSLERM